MEKVLKKFKNKKIAVVGLGKTGQELLKFLVKQNPAELVGLDAKKVSCPTFAKVSAGRQLAGVRCQFGKNYLKNLAEFNIVFVSPGISADLPEIKYARDAGVEITSETELFFNLCPAKIIGVTGTNGKTTTVKLLETILKSVVGSQLSNVFTGGNIGQPLINQLDQIKKNDLVLLELSSFQLENLKKSPNISVILNITPDHLDRHPDMDEYQRAKANIIKYQNAGDFAVLNFDDPATYKLSKHVTFNLIGFSRTRELENGVFAKNGEISYKFTKSPAKGIGKQGVICKVSGINLLGPGNLENVLAVSAVALLCGVAPEKIADCIKKFKGLEHRIEFAGKAKGVTYYNDSKSTTPASTVMALRAFPQSVILIAGGYDKGVSFSDLAKGIFSSKVKHLVLFGQTASKIQEAVLGVQQERYGGLDRLRRIQTNMYPNTTEVVKDLKSAMVEVKKIVQKGDIVLFSPACASFDQFTDYKERGKKFKEMVNEY